MVFQHSLQIHEKILFPSVILLSYHTRAYMSRHTRGAFNWSVWQCLKVKCQCLPWVKDISAVSRWKRSILFILSRPTTWTHTCTRAREIRKQHKREPSHRNECVPYKQQKEVGVSEMVAWKHISKYFTFCWRPWWRALWREPSRSAPGTPRSPSRLIDW